MGASDKGQTIFGDQARATPGSNFRASRFIWAQEVDRELPNHARTRVRIGGGWGTRGCMKRWLARFSFSFLILGGLLIYQGYKEIRQASPGAGGGRWRVMLYFVGAGIALGLSAKGVRERHKMLDEEGEQRRRSMEQDRDRED